MSDKVPCAAASQPAVAQLFARGRFESSAHFTQSFGSVKQEASNDRPLAIFSCAAIPIFVIRAHLRWTKYFCLEHWKILSLRRLLVCKGCEEELKLCFR
jgi:hypothetical protein